MTLLFNSQHTNMNIRTITRYQNSCDPICINDLQALSLNVMLCVVHLPTNLSHYSTYWSSDDVDRINVEIKATLKVASLIAKITLRTLLSRSYKKRLPLQVKY